MTVKQRFAEIVRSQIDRHIHGAQPHLDEIEFLLALVTFIAQADEAFWNLPENVIEIADGTDGDCTRGNRHAWRERLEAFGIPPE